MDHCLIVFDHLIWRYLRSWWAVVWSWRI